MKQQSSFTKYMLCGVEVCVCDGAEFILDKMLRDGDSEDFFDWTTTLCRTLCFLMPPVGYACTPFCPIILKRVVIAWWFGTFNFIETFSNVLYLSCCQLIIFKFYLLRKWLLHHAVFWCLWSKITTRVRTYLSHFYIPANSSLLLFSVVGF